ncbi:MAG: DUF2974 domain-containing protein [bacterium]|nr:DUF2974 domain-containing protein [bacterium]
MANMLDYVLWRGDIDLDYSPWNVIDTLVVATLSYIALEPAASGEGAGLPEIAEQLYAPLGGDRLLSPGAPDEIARMNDSDRFIASFRRLLFLAAVSRRYRDIRLHDYVDILDKKQNLQFSAVTATLPNGVQLVAFRGTDDTMVGWREDFNMSFGTVEAQLRARDYLSRIAEGCRGGIITAGHSKGGNLAVYASSTVPPSVRGRLIGVYSFDGPGLDAQTAALEGYQVLRPSLHSYVPQRSVVGMLLCYHGGYKVVRSTERGMMQHNPFSWQVMVTGFVECEEIDDSSVIISDVLHQWLREMPVENRRLFVTTLFDLLEENDVTGMSQLLDNVGGTAERLLRKTMKLGKDEKKLFLSMLSRFFSLFTDEIKEALQKRGQQSTSRYLMLLHKYYTSRAENEWKLTSGEQKE